VDQPVAALIRDLRQRGLLDSTLVVWSSEFGRTPFAQGGNGAANAKNAGRDHHKDAFTVWVAGGGTKGGISFGETDDLGYTIAENPVHVHDFNATLLHLMGMNHERLTFRYQGRQYRLTDVEGRVVREILA
jgi:arylsulfatase A-like enzyme